MEQNEIKKAYYRAIGHSQFVDDNSHNMTFDDWADSNLGECHYGAYAAIEAVLHEICQTEIESGTPAQLKNAVEGILSAFADFVCHSSLKAKFDSSFTSAYAHMIRASERENIAQRGLFGKSEKEVLDAIEEAYRKDYEGEALPDDIPNTKTCH